MFPLFIVSDKPLKPIMSETEILKDTQFSITQKAGTTYIVIKVRTAAILGAIVSGLKLMGYW